jgi:hypothetical protein
MDSFFVSVPPLNSIKPVYSQRVVSRLPTAAYFNLGYTASITSEYDS